MLGSFQDRTDTNSDSGLPNVLCVSEHLHQSLEGRKQALILPSCQQLAAVVPQVNGRVFYHPRLPDLCSELCRPQEAGGSVGRQSLDPVSGQERSKGRENIVIEKDSGHMVLLAVRK